MKSITYVLFLFLVSLNLMGCSGSSSSSSSSEDSSGVSNVSDLPAATSAVEDGASASISALRMKALGTSSTGMPLGSIDSDDFDSNSSHASCESFNMTKTAINEAARGDLIQCYITTTFDNFADTQGIDIYDGQYHVFALDFTGSSFDEGEDAGGPSKIKFKVVKTGDVVTQFEMFACGDNGGDDEAQSMYLNQTISGTSFSMVSKNIGSQGSETWSDSVEVSGTLVDGVFVDESNGEATPKSIHMQHTFVNEDDGFDFYGDITFNQASDSATITGYMSGSNSFQDTSCSFTNNLYATLDLIDNNVDGSTYEIGLLEVGDGAAKNSFSGECEGFGSWEDTITEAWDGITATEVESSASDHYATAEAATLGDAVTEPTISFDSDEEVDCTGEEAEATVLFADIESGGVDIAGTCSVLELSHNHIDCYNIVDNGGD